MAKKIKHSTLYDSSKHYFAGPNGMNNEVTMWYVAGGILMQEYMKRHGHKPYGGLQSARGYDEQKKLQPIHILDVCSGPGELPNHLSAIYSRLTATCIDINKNFIIEGSSRFPSWEFIQADAVTFRLKKRFDVITISSAYHHIVDQKKSEFIKNLERHLARKGIIIMCDNFLPKYVNKKSRLFAVQKYYYELKKYYQAGNSTQKALKIIDDVYRQDIAKEGEYKVSFYIFEKQCKQAGLTIVKDIPVWQPRSLQCDNGGSHVLVLQKK